MENDESLSYSNKLNSAISNKLCNGKIRQLFEDSQKLLLALKDNYQDYLNIISKDNRIKNHAIKKIKELFLLSTDQKNEGNDQLLLSLYSVQTEYKELKKVYNYLMSLLENKTESGEIPNFIHISYMAIQSHLDKKILSDTNNEPEVHAYSHNNSSILLTDIENELSSSMNSTQINSKSILDLSESSSYTSVHFSPSSSPRSPKSKHSKRISLNAEPNSAQKKIMNSDDTFKFPISRQSYNSQPSSPKRNINFQLNPRQIHFQIDNNSKTLGGYDNHHPFNGFKSKPNKLQAKSMLNFSLFDRSKINNLPKKTKSDMLNRASSISYRVSRLNDISDLTNQIGICQKKIAKLDNKIQKMKIYSQKTIENRIEKAKHFTLEKGVQSFQLADYADKAVNCDQIANINEMKKLITKNAGEATQQMLAIQQLQDLQNYLNQLEIELKVVLLENDRKMSHFKSTIANLKAIDPYYYGNIVKNINFSSKLTEIKEKKEKRLKAIENRVCEMKNQNDQITAKNNDLSFIIENLKKQRMRMAQIPKADVKQLCSSLKIDRSIVNENNRQITFVKIIHNHLERKLLKLNEQYSDQSFERMNDEIDFLKNKVDELKIKFDHLRAARENHSFVLTNSNELKFLQSRIHDLISAIDVSKMRMGGLISKIEKLMRLINQQQIPLPNPPHSYIVHQENVMKNKNIH